MEHDDDDDDEDVEEEDNVADFDEDMVYNDDAEEDEENDEDDDEEEEEENANKSSFEKTDELIRKTINKIEEEQLKEKPWQLKGEVDASSRPQNSLLEEYVDFESGQRPAPVITEEFSKRLEQIILERIKDQKFDDVERKVKQVEQPFEYKRRIILDMEKSKSSLAQIYEAEFLKRRDGEQEQAEPAPHTDIRTRMRRLFLQLDALCNFHYTPKSAHSEIKIVNNLPAITVEEAIPAAVSDAQLVAPQEIVQPPKREVKGQTEKTQADKNRDRKLKKLKIKQQTQLRIQKGQLPSKTVKASRKSLAKTKSGKFNQPKVTTHEGIQNAFLKLHKN